jgi:hypothetical protein
MKLVKFKNGKYGVRKWTLVGYRFLGSDSAGNQEYYWWRAVKEYVQDQATMTKDQALKRMEQYKNRHNDPKPEPFDNGEPVKLREDEEAVLIIEAKGESLWHKANFENCQGMLLQAEYELNELKILIEDIKNLKNKYLIKKRIEQWEEEKDK